MAVAASVALLQNARVMDVPRARTLRAAMIAAVVIVSTLAYVDLRREQARALDDFTAEQATLATALGAALEARLAAVHHELRAALGDSDGEARLRELTAGGSIYRSATLIDAQGGVVEIVGRAGPDAVDPLARSQARTALLAAAAGGKLAISGPLPQNARADSPAQLRLFALRVAGRTAMLAVDSDRLFDGLQQPSDAAPPLVRYLMADDAQRFSAVDASTSPGQPARLVADAARLPADVLALFHQMGAGARGAVTLSREGAGSLGLDRRLAVAGFAPVQVADHRPWAVAVVASAQRVRDRARVSGWRLLAATGLTSLLVGLFGLLLSRQQRRAIELADQLRLASTSAALRERSEKIVEAIPIGVLALDAALRVTSVNPYLAERQVSASGTLAAVLPKASDDDRGALEGLLKEARASRRPVERSGLRLRLATDEVRELDVYAIPLERPLPDTDCFLVLHDRTEMRLLERNLARAEKLATIGTLAAGVAHEIGTPLGIISGRAEQLLERAATLDGADGLQKGLSSILSQVDKVSTTIRQLLDFARVRPIEAVAVTPAHLLETAGALLDHRFRQARVALSLDANTAVPAVSADPGQLEQVFVNLLMNASDACVPGGHVSVVASRSGDRVCVEVRDDGCGIAPEHLPSVLDPFFTTKKRGQGTGLGLTIAADIVKNHGGALEIDSAVGRGTTVRVFLPIAPPIAP